MEVKDLDHDFRDGVLLIQLLEILTSKSIKHNRTPRMEVQKLENIEMALHIMQGDCKIHLINIGPRDIQEGNPKLILALIWALILHFKIKIGSGNESDSNDELLRWINKQIPTYNIKNFTSDWQSGKAICALAEVIKPGQMKLPTDFTNDPLKDCTMGIKNANHNMDIPIIIDPEDVVQHPDKQAMMTYLSYFREYANNKDTTDKQKELELIPDITKCIVYGHGLEPGNESGNSTYFTIEIRNAANRKVPQGGHNLYVRMTGPHSQQQFSATDHHDGTYFVTYTPEEGGNYVVEVRLENKPIQSSPFHVTIQAAAAPTISEPAPCWFVLKELKPKEIWHPYDQTTNDILERNFQNYGGGSVYILNNSYKVDLSLKEETNLQKKGFITGPEKRPIRRGTWYWCDDDNAFVPYSEEIAVHLEKAYKEGMFANSAKVYLPGKKKVRFVIEESPDNFRQFRTSSSAKPEGRPVQRGYKGQTYAKKAQ
jgi:hypothetical protein